MSYVIQIKNDSGSVQTWAGKEFAIAEEYTIPSDTNRFKYSNNSALLTAIGSGDALVGDGTEYFTDINKAVNWLKNIDPIVTVYAQSAAPDLNFRGKGIEQTITAGQTQNVDYLITEAREFDEIVIILKDHVFGDKADLQFVDKDGVAYPAGTVLATFFYDYYFAEDQQNQGILKVDYTGTLVAGFYLRLKYYSTGGTDVKVKANLFLHKKG